VGDRTSLPVEDTVQRINWVTIAKPVAPIRAEVQVRYRSPCPSDVVPWTMPVSSSFFDEPQFSITAGQAAVWYDMVLGGGIMKTDKLVHMIVAVKSKEGYLESLSRGIARCSAG